MQSTGPTPSLAVSPQRLAAAFADVPDPRRAARVPYPLAAMLALAASAILANHLSVLAIAEGGARQRREVQTLLGFPDGRIPCQSTRQRLFRQMDGDAHDLLRAQRRATGGDRSPRHRHGRQGPAGSVALCRERRSGPRADRRVP